MNVLIETENDTRKTLLHVGCGRNGRQNTHHLFHGSEWKHVRFDIDVTCEPDIVGDMRTLVGIEDGSVDAVYSSHNLEHLHYNEVFDALKNFRRVLRDRGQLVIVVPDFRLACAKVAEGQGLDTLYVSPAGPITALDMIFGFRPYTEHNAYMQHRTGFTTLWLRNVLIDQGFSIVETCSPDNGYDIWAFARKFV